ncbi:trigger factor [Rhodococcus sp. BP-149]|uniref:trigger factor n=1 Tax=unclassified Rhodococcus (in: high G+C Gram-positive bacteria) TaxID=192944 RepID=UPI001C9B3274|nr:MULTISPECIES: trigger factor [unclassified Rhodococcus (in: high G+C Gram-positive bacteria)]MBY6686314.1 trigger factor [Rhodococcus sp. BP-288]MBY6693597.1 trigger factor [Rhodococcus sp. BP-188]MBY6699806.1 trigger factor [Rhodococcus sp. BP-285]MBY6703849.1 trigger factor [Rhodococcus sp. BP-283]MBY6711003.1 trigger factor [Rhodococcus sp. BP-160]
MKSTVEQLSPTRVRINVEVPFEELKPDFDRAYKTLAQQIRLPGFRPGKAPAKLLEARVGRANVLNQVVNDALPAKYNDALSSTELKPLGQPDIEITKLEDGEEIVFTAEVDVRPEITLPDFSSVTVTVDPVEITDEAVDEQLLSLRQRFGTLTGVERAAQTGDFVSIDLSATVDGEDVAEASTEGLSHEVGSGQLIEGLDDAIVGLSVGDSKEFPTTLLAGEHAGREAQVTVTVKSVKERELPEPDDEFAQLASQFDTFDELMADLRERVARVKKVEQAGQIRDKVLEALLESVEVPVPEAFVKAEVDSALHDAIHPLDHDEDKLAQQLEAAGSSREEFDTNARESAEKSVRTQLLLDTIADAESVQVGQEELTQNIVFQAQRYGIAPEEFIQQVQQANQLPALFADIRRSKALAAIVDRVSVTDTAGASVDTKELFGDPKDEATDETESAEIESSTDESAADDSSAGEQQK